MKQLLIRKSHRWLGIVAALQLLIWTGSGLFFAVMPIDDIRGTQLIEQPASYRLGHVNLVSPSSLVRQHPSLAMVSLAQIEINQRLNTPVYIVNIKSSDVKAGDAWLVFNAETGQPLAPLTEAEARTTAANVTRLPLRSATLVTKVEAGSEYRDGELPAWKIALEGSGHPTLWVGANTGQLRAVRTTSWRIYDFLWSLHIMDYQGRDNFNSWLLRGFALLGFTTIISGMVLFVMSRRRRKPGRRSKRLASGS